MRRLGVSIKNKDIERKAPIVDAWTDIVTERLNVYVGAAWPTNAEVPKNQWVVFYNTTANEVRMVANKAGTIVKSAAFA